MIASYVSISRGVLNSMPYFALLAVVTLLSVGGAVLALYLIRRFLGQWRSSADAAVIGGVAAMVLTLFALLLAFGIITLYDQRQAAQSAVAREAAGLAVIRRDAYVLDPANDDLQPTEMKANPIVNGVNSYVCSVWRDEFPKMRDGESTEAPVGNLTTVFKKLATFTPPDATRTPFYEAAVAQLNDVVTQRRNRLESVDNALPFAFAVLLILTALISIILTCFIKTTGLSRHGTPHAGIEYLLVGSVAFVVAAGLLTALIFEFPFSGLGLTRSC